MNNFTVYMHLMPNMKMYIGITSQGVNHRWNNGRGYENQKLIHRAIKKYGWKNIEHIIVIEKLTQEDACKLEIDLIKYFDTTNPKNGYNCSTGGDGAFGVKLSEEHKRKIGKASVGNKHALGYHHTEESKRKISEASMGNTHTLGFVHTDETKNKMSQCRTKEHKQNISKGMIGVKKSEEHKKNISKARTGIRHSEETIQKISKPILQYDLNNNFIKEWESASIVFRKLNISNTSICSCCKGKLKTSGGFIWKFKC